MILSLPFAEQIELSFIALLIFATSILLSYLYYKREIDRLKLLQNIEKNQLNSELEESEREIDYLKSQLEKVRIRNATLEARLERVGELTSSYRELQAKYERSQSIINELSNELTKVETLFEDERRVYAEKIDELKEYREEMKRDFREIANSILKENSQEYSKISTEKIWSVIAPFKQDIDEFKRKVENIHIQESKDISALRNELNHIRELNIKLSSEASRLSRALESENKIQGIWGEMVLERVLEISGLKKGIEYEREVTLYIGKEKFRPDVVVHLPDNRDVIIDAKTSLKAYIDYINADNKIDKEEAIKRHTSSINEHIKRLSSKDYTSLKGINTIDTVLMFIPVENALSLALERDNTLYEKAYLKRIVLVTPASLLTALRAIEHNWKNMKQNKNAVEIAQKAGEMYDKFVSMLEDIHKMKRQLDTVVGTNENIIKKLSEGKGNLIDRSNELKKLGARAKKDISY